MMTFDPTFSTLYALRDKLAEISNRTRGILAEMKRIRSAPPHADDIAEQFRRGLDNAAAEYEARLASHFNDPHASDTSLISGDGIAAYLMRDLVAAKIPDLIKKLSPDAERGLPSNERRRLLQEADGQLDRLSADLEIVRLAFSKEKYELSQQRQTARHERIDKALFAIQREELSLAEDFDALRAAADELQQVRSGGPRLA